MEFGRYLSEKESYKIRLRDYENLYVNLGGIQMLYKEFKKGINLGGWLSQYDCLPKPPKTQQELEEHLYSFLTKKDLEQITKWGFDHIRLPVSGYLLYNKEGRLLNKLPFHLIHQCISWCKELHLNIVLDIHDFWGNVYGAMDKPMPLLTDSELKQHFFSLWELLSEHLKGSRDIIIMFELLNEVSDASGHLWNRLWQETVQKIRRIDTKRWILVGSNGQNSVSYLPQLDITQDPNVFYNFHFYTPLSFTHQRAHFSEDMREFNQTISYPGDLSVFGDYLRHHPQFQDKHALTANETENDKNLMERLLRDAERFSLSCRTGLYCGEFGVINTAPPQDGARWISDLVHLLEQNKIGHALWNYKSLDFGLLDQKGHIVSEELVSKICDLNQNEGN